MRQKNKHVVSLLAAVLFAVFFTVSCRPDPDEFARPAELAGTIRTQLEGMGNFTHYLKGLDKTVYAVPLSTGGSWTVFAPNDEAFEEFMAEEGYASVDEIASSRLLHIIQNSIIIDAWNPTTLSYSTNAGYYTGRAFKKRTQYQDTIVTIKGSDYPNIEDADLDATYNVDLSHGQLKPTSYFIEAYIDGDGNLIENEDVEFIFGETYNQGDIKVFEANVTKETIVAENGLIYELDKVLEPRETVYQHLTSFEYEGKYSMFKSLIDRFAFFSSQGFQPLDNGEEVLVYQLEFQNSLENNLLPFDINEEAFPQLKSGNNFTENYSTGILAPTNQTLIDYLNGNSILGQFYDSYEDMPLDVVGLFLSPHFITDFWSLCPSQEGNVLSAASEFIDYSVDDAVDIKLCSNSLFVGVDKVYTNDSFSTILGTLLLDPDYSIMLKAVRGLGYADGFKSKSSRFSIFGITNDQFKNFVFDDPNSATRQVQIVDYTEDLSVIQIQVTGDPVAANNRLYPESLVSPLAGDVSYVQNTLEDIVDNHIIDGDVDFNADNYYQTRSGEYIYANNGSVAGAGDIQLNRVAKSTGNRASNNGVFYEMDAHLERPLDFAYKTLADKPEAFATFVTALEVAGLLVDIVGYDEDKLLTITNSARRYTILAPNNAAMQQAVNDGVIKDPNNMPTDALEFAIARNELEDFIRLHFIQVPIPTDGSTSGEVRTLFYERLIDFEPLYITVDVDNFNSPEEKSLRINSSSDGSFIAATADNVNLFAKGTVIHEIDNYIKF